VRKHHLLFSLH